MWLRHCFQEQTPVGTAYEKNIVDNLRVGHICVRQQERGGCCGNYPIIFELTAPDTLPHSPTAP